MTDLPAQPKSERKRQRKLLRDRATDRDAFEITPFGRKRKSPIPTPVQKLFSAVAAFVLYVYHWLRNDGLPAPAPTTPTESPAGPTRQAA